MENKNIIKVAMVCHFSSPELREKLPLSNMRGLNIFLSLTHQHKFVYGDYAKWIVGIASRVHLFEDIEMHIIAPHFGLKTNLCEFCDNKVFYHIINNRPSYLAQGIYRRIIGYSHLKFKKNYDRIHQIIKKVKPDIVVLVGAENPDYSGSVLGVDNIPIYVLCQTIFNNSDFEKFYPPKEYNYRKEIEKKILQKTPYVGVNNEKFYKLLRDNGYKGNIFHFEWVTNAKAHKLDGEKKYDFVNFANSMSSQKGYHDSIKAISIVKQKFPHVKLVLVNNGPARVEKELVNLIHELGVEENVTFVPYFPAQSDLFQFLSSVRFAVLPCKLDNISGTMTQSLTRGIPIVVYRTTGTPDFNLKRRCALIAEMNDIEGLANHMISLLENPLLAEELSQNGIAEMEERINKKQDSMEKIVENLHAIISHYRYGISIPNEMLC